MMRTRVVISGTVAGALGFTLVTETMPVDDHDAMRPIAPRRVVYVTPHQQQGGDDHALHRDPQGVVRILSGTIITTTSGTSAPVALSTEVAFDVRRVYVPFTVQSSGFVFGQEYYRSA